MGLIFTAETRRGVNASASVLERCTFSSLGRGAIDDPIPRISVHVREGVPEGKVDFSVRRSRDTLAPPRSQLGQVAATGTRSLSSSTPAAGKVVAVRDALQMVGCMVDCFSRFELTGAKHCRQWMKRWKRMRQ